MSTPTKSAGKWGLPRPVADPSLQQNLQFLARSLERVDDKASAVVIGAPYFQYLKESVGGVAGTADLFLRTFIPADADRTDRKGTLSAWVARGSTGDADPDAAADGTIRLIGTTLLGPSDLWTLTAGGTAALLNDLPVDAGKGKRIYFQLDLEDGTTTGKRDFRLGPTTSPITPLGELDDGVIKLRQQFATSLTPIEIVSALPTTGNFKGRTAVLTTDGLLYRYDGSAWVSVVRTADLVGQVVASQIADAAVSTAKFAAGIEPVTIVSSVPTTKSTNTIYNTTDRKLYRWNGTAYTGSVAASDLSGTINLATQVSGTLSTAFAAAGLINNNVTINADGSLSGAGGGQASLTSLPGTIAAGQIAANAVTTSALAALAVTAAKIAANTITAGQIAGRTLTAAEIATGTITANEIAADTITAGQIAAGAISTSELAAGAVTAEKIFSHTITAAQIAAGTVTATEIAGGTITGDKIAANTITGGLINAGAIQTTHLAANSVTAAKLAALSLEVGKYIRSTSYVAGSSGWSIAADGSVEFNDGTFRGTVSAEAVVAAGTFTATQVDFQNALSCGGSFTCEGVLFIDATGFGGTFIENNGGNLRPRTLNKTWTFEDATGNATAPSGGSWVNGSDERLKTGVVALDPADSLARLRQVQAVRYEVKGRRHFGYLAQSLREVLPEVVVEMPGLYEEREGMLGVDYVALVPVLAEAIRNLDDRLITAGL